MKDFSQELQYLFATEAFKAISNSDFIQLPQLFAVQKILIKLGFPYDLEFSPGTRRNASAAELTIYINPTTTLQFIFSLEPNGSIFD